MSKSVKIMDVTLRDGSYACNFKYTLAQQKAITKGLESLGIDYIEIGHGMGLRASSPQNGIALYSDEEYLKCAQMNLKKAKYGVFCIPGIAKLEDIDKAAEFGISFIRIGVNITDIKNAEPYIKRAKENKLNVMVNFMKTYAKSPEYVAEQAAMAEQYGANYVYIVDSAGCMMPSDVEEYFSAVNAMTKVKLGFHGHDNLGMAMANTLKAAEVGYDIVDCTLQGIGRSAGNTPIELFVICASKNGFDLDIDIPSMLNLSKKYVYPLHSRYNNIDVMCGVVGMHTGFLGAVNKMAGKYGVNPMLLMQEYSKYSQVHMDIDILEKMAQNFPEDIESYLIADFNGYFGIGQY